MFNPQQAAEINLLQSTGAEAPPLAPPALPGEPTLAALPLGARLVLRCRSDWRDATVVAITSDRVVLSVNAPSGRTYRVRRPTTAVLCYDGHIPVLGEGCWRAGLVRYDSRW